MVRSQFKLLRDEEGIVEVDKQKKTGEYQFADDKEMVQINELFKELTITEKKFDDKDV